MFGALPVINGLSIHPLSLAEEGNEGSHYSK